jgi:membrane dipeptidase
MTDFKIFDGHNDLLARLYMAGGVQAASQYLEGRPSGHLDAQKARAGHFAGGFFAVWIPSPGPKAEKAHEMVKAAYDVPLDGMLDQAKALDVARVQIETLKALEALGALEICTSAADIRACLDGERMAAILHLEGAEAIDPDFVVLDEFHGTGLRSLGPVWSRPTIYGHGVPFRFPSSPDIGPGLTEHGKRLIARCNAMKIMIDLSHLNEAGFWDVEQLSDAPLVATHSNVHAICPHARNLTDRQLDAIAASKGVVGLNFAAAFLRRDGRMRGDVPLGVMLQHLDHLITRMGEDHVALGSDFDGAVIPQEIGSVAGLPNLTRAMEQHGYDAPLIEKLCSGNWLRVLALSLGD